MQEIVLLYGLKIAISLVCIILGGIGISNLHSKFKRARNQEVLESDGILDGLTIISYVLSLIMFFGGIFCYFAFSIILTLKFIT